MSQAKEDKRDTYAATEDVEEARSSDGVQREAAAPVADPAPQHPVLEVRPLGSRCNV